MRAAERDRKRSAAAGIRGRVMALSVTVAGVGTTDGNRKAERRRGDAWGDLAVLRRSAREFYAKLDRAEGMMRELVASDAQFEPVIRVTTALMVNVELVMAVLSGLPVAVGVFDGQTMRSCRRAARDDDTIGLDTVEGLTRAWRQFEAVRNSGAQLYGRLNRAVMYAQELTVTDGQFGPVTGVMTAAGVNVRLLRHVLGELRPPNALLRVPE
jgi:hypothetical protein